MIIQCDFDGTIIKNNMSVLIREEFSQDDWKKIDSDYNRGLISVEESNKLQFKPIKAPKEKLQEFIRQHIELRAGFLELLSYCQNRDIELIIVSSGLDFYIETVLEEIGIQDLELHCGTTTFNDNGISISYYDPDGNILNQGFKLKYLNWLKKRDRKIVYAGDGLSDLEASLHTNYVFAISHLLELLKDKAVPYSSFSDFHDLLNHDQLSKQ
ncbi:MtnX-like HAD-IB family phosphatase [Chloroflexota bacterium]